MAFTLAAGRLNRRITLERKTATRDPIYRSEVVAWAPVVTVWAEVQDVLPSRAEKVADGINIARRPARITLRYRDDITSDMRVIFGDRVLQIIAGPAVLGNRQAIELMCEEYSTAGDAP